ncbi:MAG: GNAT family N-acetyltransferase [Firmicutes bacterium]|nr:GNAT family N-acetyltransferase [Lachnospiraceae bacterium]MBQ7057680.1 GNAT family N-acetyltransferase [Bacillota bacterium]
MYIHEVVPDETVLAKLIRLSEDWTAVNSCYGYRPNERSDIEGKRIFLAGEDGEIAGYLFGRVFQSEQMKSVMPEGTPCFEVEELYVVPEKRSRGIGEKLFRYAEEAVKTEAAYMVLSTASKNWKALFHFYLDELSMSFWSARLFKKIE